MGCLIRYDSKIVSGSFPRVTKHLQSLRMQSLTLSTKKCYHN